MFTASVLARGKAAIAGSETEQRISVLLYDDAVQEISSFELNQLASLTYHEAQVITSATDMADLLVDHLEKIQSKAAQYSPTSMQKSLVVTEHLLLFGAEKVIRVIQQQLGRHIDALRSYNTVLLAQQQTGAWWMRIKGGGVDLGGPVREKAERIIRYLQTPAVLQQERQRKADPNSLVPIGSQQQVAFCTDEMRYQKLKEQMERQHAMQVRSNLAKASDGFGSGYNAANGQMVVGAAHGLEEMLAKQQRQEQKFRDDRDAAAKAQSQGFSEYQAPNLMDANINMNTGIGLAPVAAPLPTPEVDLLDFGSTPNGPAYDAPVQSDLLAFAVPESANIIPTDPFAPSTSTSDHNLLGVADASQETSTILSASSMTMNSASPAPNLQQQQPNAMSPSASLASDPFANIAGPMNEPTRQHPIAISQPSMTNSAMNGDKFAALNDLPMATNAARPMASIMGGTVGGPSLVPPPTSTTPSISLSSIHVGQFVPQTTKEDDNDTHLMGGSMGAGLAPAPMAPPPPPPSDMM